MKRILPVAIALATLLPLSAQTLEVQLQRAVQKEAATGDLKAAIEAYKKIAATGGSNHAIAAQALLHEAEAYQKLGDAEAQKIYQRIVREFADQTEVAGEARGRLMAARGTSATGLTQRQVWSEADASYSGHISPDGRFLSYLRNGAELAFRDLTTGEGRLLTHYTAGNNLTLAGVSVWSPDGKRLAFAFGDEREIRVINDDGTGMRTLLRVPETVAIWVQAWSPDGKRILSSRSPDRQLSWISVSDGSEQVVSARSRVTQNGAYPSPDGRYIAFVAGPAAGGPQEVHLIGSDGKGEITLTAHPGGDYPVGWSPDGRYVLFMSMRSNAWGLWAIPLADGRPQGAPRLLKSDLGAPVRPLGVTKTGAIYYRSNRFASDVFTARLDSATGKVISSPTLLPISGRGYNVAPRWSPDGRRLAVTWVEPQGTRTTFRQISIFSLDDGKEQRLPPFPGAAWCWAPDGKSLLTSVEGFASITRIYIDSGETNAVIAGPPGSVQGHSCSANGRLVVYGESAGRVIKIRDLESGKDREIYRAPENSSARIPEISPNGDQVVFLGQQGRDMSLLKIPAAGGSAQVIASVRWPAQIESASGVAWSPDGRYVYYLKRPAYNEPNELFRIAATGAQEESAGLKVTGNRDLDISPDGTSIAFSTAGTPQPEVWALDGFLSSAK